MEAGPSLNLERVALVHGGLRHGAFEHPNIHSLHLVLLTARVSWPWRQALVEREAQLEAAILQQPEVWQLLAQEAPAITGPGGGMWPSNPKCRFPSKWIKLWLFYIYIYVICYYNGEKDDKLINHYCIVCRLCMMLHTHMWNKGKRAARVDVVREKERERVDVVKQCGSLNFIWHLLSQIYLWEWFCMVLQESLENINFMPSVTAFYCTPRCFLVRCIMNWCKNNGKQNASLVCLGSHCSSSFSHSLKCGFHSQWDSRIQHW